MHKINYYYQEVQTIIRNKYLDFINIYAKIKKK